MKVSRMAWRNLWRNRRRTSVTLAATSFGLLMMVLYSSLMAGYLRDMERNLVDLELGDLQVFAGDYRANPSIYTRIEDPDALLRPLREAGLDASARLLAFGLAAAEESSAGVSFRGIDVERDARVSQVHREVSQGEWLDPADPRGVVIGRRVARMLGVEPGNELLVLSQGADGSMAYDLYTVRGVLRGISDATDRTGVFMTAESFRELMVVPSGVHQIIVKGPVDAELSATAGQVRALFSQADHAEGLDVQTWRQLMPTIASMIDSAQGMIVFMFAIIYIAIGILILNAMLMAVFERVREFGVLKALGAGPGEVLRLILLESAIQTGLAVVVGFALALPCLWYLSEVGLNLVSLAGISVLGVAMNPIWRAVISPASFLGPLVTLLVIVALAVIYPALKAALIRPIDAIHHR